MRGAIGSTDEAIAGHAAGVGVGSRSRFRVGVSRPRIRRLAGDTAAAAPSLYARFGKPLLDVVLATVLLVVLAPVLIAIALVVRWRIGAPVIYRQRRTGKDGHPFTLYKFRTMVPDRRLGAAGEHRGPERRTRHKHRDDPRVTPLGRILRAWSVDEVPQLWNVLRGDMSLVGPRPELVDIVDRYFERWQLERHRVRPGITGLWQVTARNSGLIYESVELDLTYIGALSLLTDLRILARTAGAVLCRSDAY